MAEHWCQIHKTKFFKTEKMSGYAHPIKDGDGKTIGWCNEDAQELKEKLDSGEIKSQKPESPPLQEGEEATYHPAPQEVGMWWKELGEMLRAKDIDMTKPAGKAMRTAYYAQMLSVLDIKIEDK